MPESVTVIAPVPENVQPGSYFVVYSDDADGSVKLGTPVSPRIPARSPTDRSVFHLESNHLSGRHLNAAGRAGHLAGLHLKHNHLGYQDIATYQGGSFYGPTGTDGRMQFVMRLFDARGLADATTPTPFTQTFNTSPEAPRDLVVSATQSLPAPRITLEFVPSDGIVNKTGIAR